MSLTMKAADVQGDLVDSKIHGFHTLQDLDVKNIREEASARWLRPNEIHALLCNHRYFVIHVKPVNLPKSGTIVLFDRKMLRNFRKDGHNWKKKKDGKTVKEAHEHLKVGNVERIHVYYAHGLDNPTFVRRCYWLLDKSLEHIVLVHYRETQELQCSPSPSMNSNSGSVSDPSAPWLLPEELDSRGNQGYCVGENELSEPSDNTTVLNHELRLHEINTLDWDELLASNEPFNPTLPKGDKLFDQRHQVPNVANNLLGDIYSFGNPIEPIGRSTDNNISSPESAYVSSIGGQMNLNVDSREFILVNSGNSLDFLVNDGLQSQDSFGRWINEVITDSSGSVIDPVIEPSVSPSHNSYTNSTLDHHQSYVTDQIFNITDVSPAWAFSTEKTKILITGFFHTEYVHLMKSNMLVVCGDTSVTLDFVQPGVYRCLVQPHSPGLVHLYVSIDGLKPISQVLNFEYRTPFLQEPVVASDLDHKREEFQVQMRLAHLLFSTSRSLNIMSSKLSPFAVNEAKKFAVRTSGISDSWIYLIKSIEENKAPIPQAKNGIFEIILRSRLREWLIERVAEGSKKSTEYDVKGQGVIHLCAILGYTWAVHLYVWSGLSIDFRDKFGWTALHWAAYYGRERMVAALLSVGSKPNLVTDPSSKNPGGCTAADLASMNGYDGLAAYLSEKALVSHFNQMSLAGNVSGSLETSTTDTANSYNISEEQLHMKDTLAAYRTAADAAARIQSAFRENSLKQRTQAIQFSTPEDEARGVIAAMKIQHAYRNFEIRKRMAAAARIQYRFRSWKLRREFLNKRRQVIRIQAAFRGFQVRRQYSKIIWSVGVLEKAILRWRLKRKGFRGLQVEPAEEVVEQQESGIEEDFYRVSQKQAEERIEKAVVRVQAMFRSKKAQEEYRRMKLTYDEAALEYEELSHLDTNMNS